MKKKRLERMKPILEQELRDDGDERELTLEEVDEILEERKEIARAEEYERRKAREAARVIPLWEAKSGLQVGTLKGAEAGASKTRGKKTALMKKITRRTKLQTLSKDDQRSRADSRGKNDGKGR
ncbi:hypothetical protein TWF481_009392 [Arthrobotrys musiformis]|uniref:Uncharacterized protein n=1 Tax=Arthrobotrys musiformis TaxID=47236 RepID=A0AAV9W9B2_9PEZI